MPNKNGLILIKPSSIASTGTSNSSSINTNGSVTFSTCATLSLNGVFSADYDNYMVVVGYKGTSTNGLASGFRLRASGTDNSTASSYVVQQLQANNLSISGGRYTDTFAYLGGVDDSQRGGTIAFIYGPYLAAPTAFRSLTADGFDNAHITDFAGTHNQSTVYDGFTIDAQTGSFTGLVCVYGMRK